MYDAVLNLLFTVALFTKITVGTCFMGKVSYRLSPADSSAFRSVSIRTFTDNIGGFRPSGIAGRLWDAWYCKDYLTPMIRRIKLPTAGFPLLAVTILQNSEPIALCVEDSFYVNDH